MTGQQFGTTPAHFGPTHNISVSHQARCFDAVKILISSAVRNTDVLWPKTHGCEASKLGFFATTSSFTSCTKAHGYCWYLFVLPSGTHLQLGEGWHTHTHQIISTWLSSITLHLQTFVQSHLCVYLQASVFSCWQTILFCYTCVPDDCDPEIKSRTVVHIYSVQHPVAEWGHFKEERQTGRKWYK